MAYPVEAYFGSDTYALLSKCVGCGKQYDDHDGGWTTTVTFEGNMACWLLFCMDCAAKLHGEEGSDD